MSADNANFEAMIAEYNEQWVWFRQNNYGDCFTQREEWDEDTRQEFAQRQQVFLALVRQMEAVSLPHFFCWADQCYEAEFRQTRVTKWYCVKIGDLTLSDADARIGVLSEMFADDRSFVDEPDDGETFHSVYTVSRLDFDFQHNYRSLHAGVLCEMFPRYPFAWWLNKGKLLSNEELAQHQDMAIHDLDRESDKGLLWANKATKTNNLCYRFLKEALDLSRYIAPSVNRRIKSTLSAKKPLTALQTVPIETLGVLLPKLPEDCKSNDDWILATELSTMDKMPKLNSLREDRARSGSERGSTDVYGRDLRNRIWKKPEPDSKQVFYLRESIPKLTEKK